MSSLPDSSATEGHFNNLINFMLDGRVVPFLGAGANQTGRPHGAIWDVERSDYLPSGSELSKHLAVSFSYSPSDISEMTDLLHVSEYVALTSGSGALYRELHDVFNRDYPVG